MTSEQRKAVVAEARSWLRTPYLDHGMVKGAGADCALMPLAVYRAVLPGLPEIPLPHYVMQWHLHRSEELYLDYVRQLGCVETLNPQPGDFALWRRGRSYSHGAIIVASPTIIHAVNPVGVVLSDYTVDTRLARSPRLFFSF